ncbi:MAG: hypothetical protein WB777_14190 [Mycobacterium sp.]
MTINPSYGNGWWDGFQWRSHPVPLPVVEHHHWHHDPALAEIKEMLVTIQSDIDAQTAASQTQTSAIAAQTAILTDVKTAVDQIKAANPGVDTSALDTAVNGEGAAVQALQAETASLAADVNVDQPAPTPAPVDQPPVDPNTPAPAVDSNPTPVDPTPTA